MDYLKLRIPDLPKAAHTAREDTFRRLLGDFGTALQRLVNAYEGDPALREDLLQEILLELWQSIPQFRGESSERTWLYRIAHNTAISAMVSRNRRREREHVLREDFEPSSLAESPEWQLAREEERQALFQAIRELPLADRRVVTLHLDGLSYAEIEQVTGQSQNAIATRLSRARGRIVEMLGVTEKRT